MAMVIILRVKQKWTQDLRLFSAKSKNQCGQGLPNQSINQSIDHRMIWECADFEACPRTASFTWRWVSVYFTSNFRLFTLFFVFFWQANTATYSCCISSQTVASYRTSSRFSQRPGKADAPSRSTRSRTSTDWAIQWPAISSWPSMTTTWANNNEATIDWTILLCRKNGYKKSQ